MHQHITTSGERLQVPALHWGASHCTSESCCWWRLQAHTRSALCGCDESHAQPRCLRESYSQWLPCAGPRGRYRQHAGCRVAGSTHDGVLPSPQALPSTRCRSIRVRRSGRRRGTKRHPLMRADLGSATVRPVRPGMVSQACGTASRAMHGVSAWADAKLTECPACLSCGLPLVGHAM